MFSITCSAPDGSLRVKTKVEGWGFQLLGLTDFSVNVFSVLFLNTTAARRKMNQ